MKIYVDTHSHTLASGHAYSTIRENAASAKKKGLSYQAITEHAPEMPGSCGLFYFQNLDVVPREMEGIHLLMGAEVNIMDPDGNIDLPDDVCRDLDIVVASIHRPCYGLNHTEEENTNAYVNVMQNPFVNIIGHPDDGRFACDFEVLVKTAIETGTLIELNNSSFRPSSSRTNTRENMLTILDLCKQYGAYVTIGSDAHVDVDVGSFSNVLEMLDEVNFPEELVATADSEKWKSFLNAFQEEKGGL